MLIPAILIIAGLYFLFQHTGWTFNFVADWNLYWPLVLILIGLVIASRQR